MNIMFLNSDIETCAKEHCDKHIIKMPIEYAQLLSTTHRVLDGTLTLISLPNGINKLIRLLPGETYQIVERIKLKKVSGVIYPIKKYIIKYSTGMYGSTHVNHPMAIWVRRSNNNYNWLHSLMCACLNEYTHRFKKTMKTQELVGVLKPLPNNIPFYAIKDLPSHIFSTTPICMPEDCVVKNNPVLSYQRFYSLRKRRFAKWTNRIEPQWFTNFTLT